MTNLFDRIDNGNIQTEEFSLILQRAYAAYGLSVVTDRALPDARDGLKPVQRRILYGMLVGRYLSSRSTVKCAEIVGKILGDYHPHGDISVYDALVRLAQDFTVRYLLVDGQGNFGSVDNDPPAAYRYTEARLTPMAEQLMADIEKDTVSLRPTYKQDPRVLEPDYLPGRIPPVCNPSSGIAVGLSTNILPHNLSEVMRAAIYLLDKPDTSVDKLMDYIKGPDFPGGGAVIGLDGIKSYLETGKGRIICRGEVRLEENPRTRQKSLVVVSIPPIGRNKVKDSIVKAVNDRKLESLVPEVLDESDAEKGTRITLTLKKDVDPAQALSQLYAETDLQIAVTAQMVFLFGEPMAAARQPKQVGMIELLNYWNKHQLDVLRRRSEYDLARARERLHIVEGLIIGSANAQQIVKIFQEAANRDEAKAKIAVKYKLSDKQVAVIADMTLAQVTRLDAGKYNDEKVELTARIAELEALLADPAKLVALLKREMQDIIKRFGDDRRTAILGDVAAGEVTEVASIVDRKPVQILLGADGSIKRVADSGGRGKTGALSFAPLNCTTQDHLLFMTNTGRAFGLSVHDVPEGTRASKGESLKKFLKLATKESVVAMLAVDDFRDDLHIVEFTRLGKLKKAPASEYRAAGEEAVPDFKLAADDEVIGAIVIPTQTVEGAPSGEYLITTDKGNTLRFSDADVRAQAGRQGQGVQAINVPAGASVVSAEYLPGNAEATAYLLVVTEAGLGKKTPVEQYPAKGRATNGIATIELTPGDKVAKAIIISQSSEVTLISAKGQSISFTAGPLPAAARPARGNKLISLEKSGDTVAKAFAV